MLTIYNTLTRKKETFAPLEKGKIKMYVCGPTVYDVPHIGHARSAYVFDVIRRYLEKSGFEVIFVRNVTDVDDKIIKRALDEIEQEGGKEENLKEKVKETAAKYLKIYHDQMDIFGILPPTQEPKATENIPGMVSFIEKIVEKGYGYTAGGDVYFSVDKFAGYGKLSNRDKEEMAEGVRIEVGDKKKYPLDFALWKSAKENEPSWESPWGQGRPGWHIECSVMSTGILGESFDIHGGGLDLIFPHHENEIAQAKCATGKDFARFWVHNGLLTVGGEKMSKSLGNYITVEDFLDKHNDPDILKIAFLNSIYRSPMDYSDSKMEASKNAKQRISIFLEKADKKEIKSAKNRESKEVESLKEKFRKAMDDDFNTPLAMSVVFEAVKKGNETLKNIPLDKNNASLVAALKSFILETAGIFGLSFTGTDMDEGSIKEIEDLVEERENARRNKDFKKADEIRGNLLDKGITVEDTPEGPVWRKK